MARDTDHLAGSFDNENTGGLLSGFLAEEDAFDRRALWRLGSWGVASVSAVIIALYTGQSSMALRRDQVAAVDLARQAQQIQSVAKESQNETRRLAADIDTLNGDRDRLYSRVTVLEQGLDSVTGAIVKQNAAAAAPQAASAASTVAAAAEPQAAAQNPPPAPVVSPVATTSAKAADRPPVDTSIAEQGPATVASLAPKVSKPPSAAPATSLMAAKSMMAPPDAAAAKLIEPEKPANVPAAVVAAPEAVASVSPAETDAAQTAATSDVAVQRTEFGVDVGSANSIGGLRALWRGLLKSNSELAALRPIIVVRESRSGLGMQLRLVAGPFGDAAAAAKICAGLIENDRSCDTTVFDGQRLAMRADEPAAISRPAAAKPSERKRGTAKRGADDAPAKKPEASSTLSSFFGRR